MNILRELTCAFNAKRQQITQVDDLWWPSAQIDKERQCCLA